MNLYSEVEPRYISLDQKERFLEFLLKELDLDFTSYAEASVRRRIAKILQSQGLDHVDDYISMIRTGQRTRREFIESFTVNVTEMFRDPSSFNVLQRDVFSHFPENDEIKIWSAGCSSGMEVISLAILLRENNLLERCRIWGTDISEARIEMAISGTYSIDHIRSAQEAYEKAGGKLHLSNYFSEKQGQMYVDSALQKQIRYVSQDLLKDQPERGFDLILCRNLMIYFKPDLQNRMLAKLDTLLAPNGFLMLGSKESLIFYLDNQHFRELDEESRIYQKLI